MGGLYDQYLKQSSSNPEDESLSSLYDQYRAERINTARGRRDAEAESNATYLEQIEESLKDPNIDPARRASLERQRARLTPGAWGLARAGDSGRGDTLLGKASNVGRGLLAGVPKAQAGLVDLAGAAINTLAPGQPAQGLRDWAQESMAATDELLDPEGISGLVGDVGGQIISGAAPYAKLTQATAAALLRVVPQTSRLANIIRAAETGTRAQRIAGQSIISVPIDAFQAATLEDATLPEKLKQFGISFGANALAAGILPAAKPRPGISTIGELDPAKAAALPGERDAAVGGKVDEMLAAGQQTEAEKKAANELKRQQRVASAAAWRAANPGKKWRDLSTEEKQAWHAEFNARVADAESNKGIDQFLNVGNKDKLREDSPAFDADPEQVYVFGDMNGLKGINDRVGKEAGDRFMVGVAEGMKRVLKEAGIEPKVYRFGGDELVAVVPRAQAAALRDAIEQASVQKHGAETGNLSAEIFDTLEDALSKAGGKALESRKIESKARHGIPGRDAAEQKLIDNAARRIAFREAGQQELFGGTPAAGTPAVPGPTRSATPALVRSMELESRNPIGDGEAFTFRLDNGETVQVMGRLDGETFNIGFIGSSAGEASLGPSAVRQLKAKMTELTGATKFKGSRISGANPTGRVVQVGGQLTPEGATRAVEGGTGVAGSGSSRLEGPAAGMVRLWHAGSESNTGKRWVTRDYEDALGWQRQKGGDLWYVDVPEEFGMLKNPDYPDQPGLGRFELPEDLSRQMQRAPSGELPAVETLPVPAPDDLPLYFPEEQVRWDPEGDPDGFAERYQRELERGRTEQEIDAEILREIGGEELVSMAKTNEGQVGASFDKSLFKKLGATLYERGLDVVVVKETIQNAIDSVRGRNAGRIVIDFDQKRKKYMITDNGHGMSPEVAAKEFLDVGGSLKEAENASGGFGIAKVGIFSNAKSIYMQTIRLMPDRTYKATTIQGSAEDWINGTMSYEVEDISPDLAPDTGTTLEVEFEPNTKIEEYNITQFVNAVGGNSILGDIEIVYNGKEATRTGRTTAKLERGYGVPELTYEKTPVRTISLPSADIEIYPSAEKAGQSIWGVPSTSMAYLNNGLYQISDSKMTSADHPFAVVVNIKPKVPVTDPNYPFTLSREGIRKEVKESINEVMKTINQGVRTEQSHLLMDTIRNAPGMREAPLYKVIDTTGSINKNIPRQIANRSYASKMTTSVGNYLVAITQKLAARSKLIDMNPYRNEPLDLWDYEFLGIGLGRDYLGVNISRKQIGKNLQEAGVDLPPDWNDSFAILFNPFTIYDEVKRLSRDLKDIPLHVLLAEHTTGTMWHELIHNAVRGHDEAFAGALTRSFSPTIRESVEFMDGLERMWLEILEDGDFLADLDDLQTAWQNVDKKANIFKNVGHSENAGTSDRLSELGPASRTAVQGDPAGSGDGGGSGLPGGGQAGEGAGSPSPVASAAAEASGAYTPGSDLSARNEAIRALKAQLPGKTAAEKAGIFKQIADLMRGGIQNRISAEPSLAPEPSPLAPNPAQLTPPGAVTQHAEPVALGPGPAPEDWLSSVKHQKPLTELSTRQLERLKDKVIDQMDAAIESGKPTEAFDADLAKVVDAIKASRAEAKAAAKGPKVAGTPRPKKVAIGETAKPAVDVEARVEQMSAAEKAARTGVGLKRQTVPDEPPRAVDPAVARKLFIKSVKKLTPEELALHKLDLEDRMTAMTEMEKRGYQTRLDEVNEQIAELANPPRTDGVVAQMPYEIGSAVAGFFIGSSMGDTPEERKRNAILGALVGVGGGYAARRYEFRRPTSLPPSVPGQAEIRKHILTQAQIDDAAKQQGFLSRLEGWYQKTIRPSYAIEKATARAGGKTLPAHLNPGKRAAMFGAWISQAEEFLFGTPSLEGPDGNRVPLPVQNAQQIANLAGGDTQSLGELMAALTILEQYQKTGRNRTGINLAAAAQFAKNAPAHLHQAAAAARQLHVAMLDVMLDAGIISPDARVKMAEEEFYAPLERVFGLMVGEKPAKIGAKPSTNISAPNPVKRRQQGSTRPIRNPFETMVANIPRVMRAAEMNKSKLALIELRQANPDALTGLVDFQPGSKKANEVLFKAQVDALKKELDVSSDDATSLVAAFSPDSLTPISNTMSVWRNGTLETWRLDKYIAEAYKTMHPAEMEQLWKMLGAVNSPARTGIVNNPLFIAFQAFRDNWQATLNSQYGFRPGIDWIIGWREAMAKSPEYRNYLAGGGGHSSFAQRDVLDIDKALKSIKTSGSTGGRTIVNQIKQRDFAEAWHSMIAPITEAARVGEYLRARGRGASVTEAVYAAKEVVGNFQRIAPLIRGLNHTTLFLNPALKSLDQSLASAGVNPFRSPDAGRKAAAARYFTKAFLAITVPSWLFYAAADGDQEINDLRRTEAGRRFWFFRDWTGTVRKLPKPIFEGQIFGTSVEVALDAMKEQRPEEFRRWLDAVRNDAALNLLPTLAVIPVSLWANKDLNFGSSIVPQGLEGLEAPLQARSSSSVPARVASDALSPLSERLNSDEWQRVLSPAGVDYLVRGFGGTLAAEAMQAVSAAHLYQSENFLLPAAELPLIRGVLTNYPAQQTQPVEEFYRRAELIDRRARTFDHHAQNDPEAMISYYERHSKEINQVEIFRKDRAVIADLRQAIEDIRSAPPDAVTQEEKRKIIKEFQKQIIETARISVELSNLMYQTQ